MYAQFLFHHKSYPKQHVSCSKQSFLEGLVTTSQTQVYFVKLVFDN